jgi:RNA polymerase sigma factor (sigma-70 family)
MAEVPPELVALFSATDPDARDAAWANFVSLHSRLLLYAARSLGAGYDAAMDRYTYSLERLRERDFQRLRAYVPDGRTKFTTWLVVVARRLCLDHYRERYGRSPGAPSRNPEGNPDRLSDPPIRRQLADSFLQRLDPEVLAAPTRSSPESEVHRSQQLACLKTALSTLEPGDQLLLKLRFEDGLSAREIAQVVGSPSLFHIYRRLNAILRILRRQLEAKGFEEEDA